MRAGILVFITGLVLLFTLQSVATKITRSTSGSSSGSSGTTTSVADCTITWTAVTTNPTYVAAYEDCVVFTNGKWISAIYSVDITSGTGGSGVYLISVPGGGTIDTTKVVASTDCQGGHVGGSYINQGPGTFGIGFVGVYDSTHLCIITTAGGNTLARLTNAYFGFADAKKLNFYISSLPML